MEQTADPWQVWLYGLIAVTVISLLSLSGILTVPCLNRRHRQRWMHVLIALAIATLCADALLHLLPEALGAHGHGDEHSDSHESNESSEESSEESHELTNSSNLTDHDDHVHSEYIDDDHEMPDRLYLAKMSLVLITVYICYVLEFISAQAFGGHGHSHDTVTPISTDNGQAWQMTNGKEKTTAGISTMVWLILLGDGVHNFVDGMAIGATFAQSTASGFKTTIAVACHELPHEIGDFVVLLDSGMSVKQALLLNLVGSVTAYMGFAIGVLIGQVPGISGWIYSVTAGIFLYVAWVDMLHHLRNLDGVEHWTMKLFLQNIGFALGFVIIFLIGYYEHLLE